MFSLILGVLIWAYSHLMKRVTPGFRAKLGDGTGNICPFAIASDWPKLASNHRTAALVTAATTPSRKP